MKELRRVTDKVIAPLEIGRPPTNSVLLHGARGIGKTCLIEEILGSLHKSNTDALSLDAEDFETPDALSKAILRMAADKGRLKLKGIRAEAGLRNGATPTMAVVVQFGESRKTVVAPTPTDAMELATRPMRGGGGRKGLLLVLDEVHALTSEAEKKNLKGLLNAIQRASGKSRRWPVGLVMAGTPDAYGRLKSINATFVERMIGMGPHSGNMPLGCLSAAAVKQALRPIQDHGKFISDEVMEKIVEETAGYPFFVQIMGDALCRTMNANDHRADVVELDDVRQSLETYHSVKHEFCTERISEFEDAGSLESALLVIQAMRTSGKAGLKRRVVGELCGEGVRIRDAAPSAASDADRAGWALGQKDAMASILHSGLIWGVKGAMSAKFHFATPSLGDYALRYAAESDMEHLRRLASEDGSHG